MPTTDFQPDEAGSNPVITDESPKSRRAFASVTRELSDEDLRSAGVQKLLLDYLERAESENAGLRSFREKFYQAQTRIGVLEAKTAANRASDVVSLACITIGAAALGYAPSLTSTALGGYISVLFGAVLIIAGIAAKVIREWN